MKVDYRKIQGVNPVPSMRKFRAAHGPVQRQTFWDIFASPLDGSDDHLLFTIRANNRAEAVALARERLRTGGLTGSKGRFFNLDSIRTEETKHERTSNHT